MNLSEFDFSGKRVRRNGKVLFKSTLLSLINQLDPWSPYSIYDSYPYDDYVCKLKELLS